MGEEGEAEAAEGEGAAAEEALEQVEGRMEAATNEDESSERKVG